MKKILICSCLVLLTASTAFTAETIDMDFAAGKQGLNLLGDKETATAGSAVIAKTSTGVGLGIRVSTTGSGYAHVTQHKQGSKAFGTSYDSTAIYTIDATVGTVKLAKPTAIDTSDFGTWTAM